MKHNKSTDEKENRKLKDKEYGKLLRKLQVELCYLQDWVTSTGARVIILFEGRDTAGKGGIIKAITERVSPRVFRVAALPAPSTREKSQLFLQRYIEKFPAGGEIVIFDRSWYNRAGVEYVMGFLHRGRAKSIPEQLPASGKVDRRFRHHSNQDLARGGDEGTTTQVYRTHCRSTSPVETEFHGPGFLFTLV